jgi:hypothetical protein
MSASLFTMHNQRIPVMPANQHQFVWLEMGEGLRMAPNRVLFAFRERQVDQATAGLLLVMRMAAGNTLVARSPEGMNLFCTDAIVRCVESDARGPLRVLLEIGDMVAFPSLRDCGLEAAAHG